MAQKFYFVNENQQYVSSDDIYYTLNGVHRKILSAFYTVNGVHRQVFSSHEHEYIYQYTTATCIEDGENVYVCNCGEEHREHQEALGHNYEVTEEYAATCTADGYIEYTCSRCGDEYTNVVEGALGHEWDTISDSDGHWYECSRCGEVDDNDGNDYSHDWSNGVCTVCGYECAHEWGEPEPNNDGTHKYTCKKCNATEIYNCEYEWEPVSSQTHASVCKYCGHKTDESTCEWSYIGNGNGTHNRVCEVCGNIDEHNIPCETFDYISNQDGTHKIVCEVCGQTLETNAECGYEWTPTSETTHARKCSQCGYEIDEAYCEFIYNPEDGYHECMQCGNTHKAEFVSEDGDGSHCKVCGSQP